MKTINITFCGDFIPDRFTEEIIMKGEIDYFAPNITKIFKESDLSIVNLETPLTNHLEPIIKTGFNFKANPINVKLIKSLNIHIVTLANNHILDQNEKGLMDTISICKENNIDIVGAGKNLEEASKPLIKKVKGREIGIINVCENEFSVASENRAGAHPLNLIENYRQIQNLRPKVDFIIAIMHGGKEYHHIPLPNYKKKCEFFIDCGADAVIGHHTHYYSGFSYYKNRPIFYSLGNFYANSRRDDDNLYNSYCVTLSFDNDKISHTIHEIRHDKYRHLIIHSPYKNEILSHIKKLNLIINNDSLLKEHWRNVVLKESKQYINSLFSSNKWIYRIRKKMKINKKLSVYQKKMLLNTIRCESHNEFVKMILDYDFYFRK